MSRFIYGYGGSNPIELAYIQTHSINREPQYTDDGVDYLYTKVTLSFQAVFNANILPFTIGDGTATGTINRVKHYLEIPRQRIQFYVGNDVLIDSPTAGKTVDCKNGPFCRSVNIKRIGGLETHLVDCVYETYVQDCPAGGTPPSYLSHRWTDTAKMDENFYTTWTRSGRVVVRADMLTNPDSLRGVVTPVLQPGFVRKSAEYILQSDGLTLQYTITDQEAYLTFPYPACTAEGTYRESSPEGARRFIECRVRLTSSKDTQQSDNGKADLLQTAMLVAATKIHAGQGFQGTLHPNSPYMLRTVAVETALWANSVDVMFRAEITALGLTTGEIPMELDRFAEPPAGCDPAFDETNGPTARDRGTAGLQLVAAALGDPCLQATARQQTSGGTTELATGDVAPAEVFTTALLPDGNSSLLKATTGAGLYTNYLVTKRLENPPHVFQMPVAKMVSSPAASSVFIQTAAPAARMYVDWTAERVGGQPDLPTPNLRKPDGTPDTNAVLVGKTFGAANVEHGGDGENARYTISGTYIYGFKDPDVVTLTPAMTPYLQLSSIQAQMTLKAIQFKTGLIDAASPADPYQTILKAGTLP